MTQLRILIADDFGNATEQLLTEGGPGTGPCRRLSLADPYTDRVEKITVYLSEVNVLGIDITVVGNGVARDGKFGITDLARDTMVFEFSDD